MELNFCRRCGLALAHRKANLYICANNHEIYDSSIAGGVAMLLNANNEVLIGTRGVEPAKGTYDLPGGFCDTQETHREAAIRELREETGLLPGDYTELQYLTESVDLYEYKGEVKTVLGVIFWARLTSNKKPRANDDVATLEWLPIMEIDLTNTDPRIEVVRVSVMAMRRLLGLTT